MGAPRSTLRLLMISCETIEPSKAAAEKGQIQISRWREIFQPGLLAFDSADEYQASYQIERMKASANTFR